jgi:hypothetical protein
MQTALELLKYTVPALIVLITSYLIVHKFLVTQTQRKQLALLRDTQDTTVRLRLQAYERLVIFIERIQPRQLVPRVYMSGMTVRDLQQAMVYNIQTEFEHNLSQQIYVSPHVWDTVKNVKEQELNMVHQMAQQMNPEAPGKDLNMRIMDYVMSQEEEMPTTVALQIINDEAKRMLFYGLQSNNP